MGRQPSNLNPALRHLLQLLQQETELYQCLLETMGPEKRALLKADESALRRALREKEAILFELRALETRRCAVIDELADVLGLSGRRPTLGEIARQVGEPNSALLRQAGDILKTLLGTLAEENRRQKQTVEHCLAFMRSAFELLHRVTAAPTVYQRTGNVCRNRSTGNLVYNEV